MAAKTIDEMTPAEKDWDDEQWAQLDLAERAMANVSYRQNAHCGITWCVEPAGHDGDHQGEPVVAENGMVRIQVAPPSLVVDGHLHVFEIRLTERQRSGLNIGNARLSVHGARPWMGLLYEIGRILKRLWRA